MLKNVQIVYENIRKDLLFWKGRNKMFWVYTTKIITVNANYISTMQQENKIKINEKQTSNKQSRFVNLVEMY